MQIQITRFFKDAAASDYSASALELGNNAAKITWNHANEDSADFMFLDTQEKRDAFSEYMTACGFSEDFTNWTTLKVNALFLQEISATIRESGLDIDDPDWDEYERLSEEGTVCKIYPGTDGEIYYYIGE